MAVTKITLGLVWVMYSECLQMKTHRSCCIISSFIIIFKRYHDDATFISPGEWHVNPWRILYINTDSFFCFYFAVRNIKWSCPCWPLSASSSSTSWFKDGARWSPRSPSPWDCWASTATEQLWTTSHFPGNTPVTPRPGTFLQDWVCFFFLNDLVWPLPVYQLLVLEMHSFFLAF